MNCDAAVPELRGSRVAVVNWRDPDHSLAGGSEKYAWEFARAMVEAGARVDFVTARDRGQSRRERRDGIDIRRGGGTFTFYAYAVWYFLTHRNRLDVVVDPECGIPSFSPLFVRRGTTVVLIVHHVHMAQFETYFPRPLARVGQFLEGWLMPRVYHGVPCVAVSNSTSEEMREQLGWRGPVGILANGSVLPEGVDDPGAKDPSALVVLGRLVPHKRIDLVVRSVADLRAQGVDLTLDVIGRGPEEAALRTMVEELDLTEVVRIHGFLPEGEKARLLERAAIHVCASDIEGWGQVVIEAAGFGTPTLARDVPGLRDSIVDGRTGWLIQDAPSDHDVVRRRLTAALIEVTAAQRDAGNREKTFVACRDWAERFSWSRMHDEARALVVRARAGHGPDRPTTDTQRSTCTAAQQGLPAGSLPSSAGGSRTCF